MADSRAVEAVRVRREGACGWLGGRGWGVSLRGVGGERGEKGREEKGIWGTNETHGFAEDEDEVLVGDCVRGG